MSKRKTIDYRAKCEAPVEQFVTFAKGLTGPRGLNSLRTLAANPEAEHFAKRLLEEAFSGQVHAVTCMSLVGQFSQDSFWADRFRSCNVTGYPPSPQQLRPKDVEPVGRALITVFPDAAIAWIALGYLTMKGAMAPRAAVQKLLIEVAPAPDALFDALARALEAIEAEGQKVAKSVASRAIEAIVAFTALRYPNAHQQSPENSIARLAGIATRSETIRLVAAFLSVSAPIATVRTDKPELGNEASERADDVIAEAAWSQADDALARALQNAAALTHALDQTGAADSVVRGHAEILAQSVDSTAAKRELELEGVIGETARYDPGAHHADDLGLGSESVVRITVPAVAQGRKTWRKIIRKAEIEPV
jgi:hypothetical protein